MDSLEDRIRRLVMAGIGAVADTVEKSKESVSRFADEQHIRDLASKGEETVESVRALGSEAIGRIRKSLSEADIACAAKASADRIRDLASAVHALPAVERQVFDEYLGHLDRGEELREDGSLRSEEEFRFGKMQPSADADRDGDAHAPLSPTAPDDDSNINKIRADDVNDHIPQSVPPDF